MKRRKWRDKDKETIQDKANSYSFTIIVCLMVLAAGLSLGYFIGYIQGLFDFSLAYGINEMNTQLNITNNVSDYVVMQIK